MKKKHTILVYFLYAIMIVTLTYFFALKMLERKSITGFTPLPEEEFEMPEHTYACLEHINNSLLFMEMVSNCEVIFDGFAVKLPITHIRINSHGFRDYEYSIEKPDNTFRIIVLGDSITWGHGVEIEDTYSKVLESMLNKNKKNDLKYEVLNFGAPGYNTFEEVEFFKKVGIKFHPDLIMVQYHPDDIYNRTRTQEIHEEMLRGYMEERKIIHKSNIPFSVIYQLYENAYEEQQKELEGMMKKNFDDVWKAVENPLSELNDIANELDMDVLILIIHPPGAKHKNEFKKLEKFIDKHGWSIIRTDELFFKYGWSALTLHPKDNHLNAFAHSVVAEEIYEKFVNDGLI